MSEAVADAGPLIHLSEIGCLTLLTVFDAVHVPDAVWQETVDSGQVPEEALLSLGIIQPAQPARIGGHALRTRE